MTSPRDAAEAVRLRAEDHLDRGELPQALALCDHAARLDPSYAAVEVTRARGLGVKGDLLGALRALDAADALAPPSLGSLGARALALRGLGRAEEALAVVEEALSLAPDHPQLRQVRGELRAQLGQRAGAEADLAALQAPEDRLFDAAEAEAARAMLNGEPARAEDLLDAVLGEAPDRPSALLLRGFARWLVHDLTAARADLHEAARLSAELPTLRPLVAPLTGIMDEGADEALVRGLILGALRLFTASGAEAAPRPG
ncbi:tetratricopeptide repeat protein [Myxococcota bacterium]|nr:tetratricopeptide repeat protein [Myxococcota bacterium]